MLDQATLDRYIANHAVARERFGKNPAKCYQRHIRELYEELEGKHPPCTAECYPPTNKCPHLAGYTVREITKDEAETIILKYEWLQSMGRGVEACYGLFSPEGELMGANALGSMGGGVGYVVLGKEKQTVCLQRGVCVPHAPKNAGSFFTRATCKQAHIDHGWSIFFAYSDTHNASEVGTLYQSLNWYYIGEDVGRSKSGKGYHSNYHPPNGCVVGKSGKRYDKMVSSYSLNHDSERKFMRDLGWTNAEDDGPMRTWLRNHGWVEEKDYGKKKWLWFEGTPSERRALKAACRYTDRDTGQLGRPYPKNRAERKDTTRGRKAKDAATASLVSAANS
jgi:hypothetical protein